MEVFEIMSQISLFSLELLFHESVTATKSLTELVWKKNIFDDTS